MSNAGSRRIALNSGASATPLSSPSGIKLNLKSSTALRPVTVEPGAYQLLVADVRIISSASMSSGSIALAVNLIDENGAETRLKVRPLWTWSKKHDEDNQPELIEQNLLLMAEILASAGKEMPGEVGPLVEALKGVEFTAYLTLPTDRRTGERWNEIAEVLPSEQEV